MQVEARLQELGIELTAHQCGTARMGSDPDSSVVDRDCRAHEVDNLWVIDSSVFPSSAAVNPALTIMANALRVGDQIRERLGATRAGSARVSRQTVGAL